MLNPTLILALHGTRSPRGRAVAHSLALRVSELLPAPTHLAFADVLTPTVGQVAARVEGPLVVVPAFLAPGYHVRVDIPDQLARAGRPDAHLTRPLGDHPALETVATRRLRQAGHRDGDALVLACAGTSDPHAHAALDRTARNLSRRLSTPVHPAFAATADPPVDRQVARLRRAGHRRVALATWLLAPGLFHDRLLASGADVVADPLCPDPAIAHAVLDRYLEALPALTAHT
ncbi:sirohydrochlorin chelatase [Nocardiopsis sp. MG754419]|uniref:sirohydrochlorin chelatase n=1 Tax=Nocardiopsis sp. MG754419 TaxID=2259865 RepID=UPI001BAAA763|nr:sirohydrochlorin chelatase [Nocardiopsis sp. MG754419]MBR8745250.1 sirohydrochlorin chelatase [Nocardiopsis sp. MG754419]